MASRRLLLPSLFRLVAVAVALAGARPNIALAADGKGESEALITQGNELRRTGDDQGALPLFRRAYEVAPSPRTAVQLGLVEMALSRWADSEEHLSEGLKARTDSFIKKNRRVIEESLRTVKRRVGSVEIAGEPAGAEVLVNGRAVGRLPMPDPVRVGEGLVQVDVRARGYKLGSRTVTINGGQHQPLVIRLERENPAGPGAAGTTGTTPGSSGGTGTAGLTAGLTGGAGRTGSGSGASGLADRNDGESPGEIGGSNGHASAAGIEGAPPLRGRSGETGSSPDDGSGSAWQRWAALGTLAGAVVAAGVGTYGFVRHEQKVGEFGDKTCAESADPKIGVTRRDGGPVGACFSLRTEYRNAATFMYVGIGAAAALGTASLILFLTAPDTNASAASAGTASAAARAWSCSPAAGGTALSLACAGRF